MNSLRYTDGRREVFFTDHALDRYFERTGKKNLSQLRKDLKLVTYDRREPSWMLLNPWHRARAEGFLLLGADSAFVCVRQSGGNRDALVSVTFMRDEPERYLQKFPAA